eukprot:TRINITY_DN6813_c0_g1_i1.p1 TRINITY_DN6813_c0_g1~~TRINITY_DN6813_c0_g1_i1.p1  ORF type:complete len:778 (-),score=206.24 TRINITY_DN6813_c0_g1_i1:59-2323(-)
MNPAVRAVVRMAIQMHGEAFVIFNGYDGMYQNKIHRMKWHDVGGVINQGGTFIGTARCMMFMKREGRKVAVRNLLAHGIDHLIVIGGDGSLTGAHLLYSEWPELVKEIVEDEKSLPRDASRVPISPSALELHGHLSVVGLVGSIDNDLVGTDMTIGADSALNSIIRAVDALSSTAASHQREFVVEVMGRNCGWLALFGAMAAGADWVFIPEHPAAKDWKTSMCSIVKKGKEMGRRSSIVIIAEGARDEEGNKITSEEVKAALDAIGCDTRITILGHVQRGGAPTASDRIISTLLGIKAVELAFKEEKLTEPILLGTKGNEIIQIPLKKCLDRNAQLVKLLKGGQYDTVMQERGGNFKETYAIFRTLTSINPPQHTNSEKRTAVLHVGACCPGMNTAVRAIVRLGMMAGHAMFGIRNGFTGLVQRHIMPLNWMSVNGWAREAGARLGTRRVAPNEDYAAIVQCLEEYKLRNLVLVGGWDAYVAAANLWKLRETHPYLKKMSILMIPASISNNLPCTEVCIGCDTAVNNVVEAVDKIKQSAVSSSKVFVVEVMGTGGYLTAMTALATGADKIYIPEEPMTLETLQADIDQLSRSFKEHEESSSLVINNEASSKVFTTPILAALFENESNGLFEVRTASLGHLQQGGPPSAHDRTFAIQLASSAISFLEASQPEDPQSGALGLLGGDIRVTSMDEMIQEMNFVKRSTTQKWWLQLVPFVSYVTHCKLALPHSHSSEDVRVLELGETPPLDIKNPTHQ